MKKTISIILVLAVVLPCLCIPSQAFGLYRPDGMEQGYYTMMDGGSDDLLLGSLSAKYESNGNPATISSGADTGGVSYGAYQFASRFDVPLNFAKWCVSSGQGVLTGTRLIAAHQLDGNTYGANFNAAWTAIAAENSTAFLTLQHSYTKVNYYDVMVAKLEAGIPGFKVDNYTMALKNVIWSRALQNGVNTDVIFVAFQNLGGFSGQSEDVLIRAIYEQSAKLVWLPPHDNSIVIQQSSAVKYGVDTSAVVGRYMYYFSTNSSDIQVSVYKRLAINELNDALNMYASYSGTTPVTPGTDSSDTASILNIIIKVFTMLTKLFADLINMLASAFGK